MNVTSIPTLRQLFKKDLIFAIGSLTGPTALLVLILYQRQLALAGQPDIFDLVSALFAMLIGYPASLIAALLISPRLTVSKVYARFLIGLGIGTILCSILFLAFLVWMASN